MIVVIPTSVKPIQAGPTAMLPLKFLTQVNWCVLIGTFSSDDEHVNVNHRKLVNEP